MMDEHVRACLRAILDGKQMQWMLVPDKWSDCSVAQALGWLGLTYMAKSVRIKPESQVMCELAGVQYPMPMQEAPGIRSTYWVARPIGTPVFFPWDGDEVDEKHLAAQLAHATKEAAQAHSRALRAVNAQAVAKAKEQA